MSLGIENGLTGSYNGYPGSTLWNQDSRPLSEATNVLRSFVLQNIVQDNQWELDRITKYYLYWKFYEGMHYKDFNDGLLSFNYIRAFIDKVSMFLLGDEAFTFHVKSFYSTQIDKDFEKNAEQLMMYHWEKSGKKSLAYKLVQMGSVTGDAWVYVNWEDGEGKKYCKINVLDSRQVFPVFKNGDFNNIESIMIRQILSPNENKTGQPYRLFVTKLTDKSIETWKQIDSAINEEQVTKFERKVVSNPYGFMPIVHIQNRPNSAGFYGKSDANDILKLNKVYNELMQQLKAVIDYHVTPTTVITGASAKSLRKGLGQIWSGLPAEANVFNLGLDVDLSACTNFAKDLKTAMHELSDVPENALGKIQAISNTSAAALQITYHPLIQQANLKAVTYGSGIAEINNIILRILKRKDPKNSRLLKMEELIPEFLNETLIEPVFCFGFPRDKMDELQRAQMELQMKINSRRGVMEDMGKENIPEVLEEIDDETFRDAIMQLRVQEAAQVMSGEETSENNEEETVEE